MSQQKRDLLFPALHLFALAALAIAQPVYDLLARNAAFFVVRRSETVDILLLVAALSVLVPAVLVVTEIAAARVSRRLGRGLHLAFIAVLAGAIALQALERVLAIPGVWLVALAGLLGLTGAVAYARAAPVRSLLTVLSPAALVVPALFLFDPSMRRVMSAGDAAVAEAEVVAETPVVFVVFDEFPLASLLGEQGEIDAERYPAFAALAREAHWFRNATGVSPHTTQALPAILSGRYPRPGLLPTAADHPRNLFTWLGGSHALEVNEPITRLCPERLCGRADDAEDLPTRLSSLLSDVAIVYGHLLLPRDLARGLPAVTRQWRGFTLAVHPESDPNGDRPGDFRAFIETVGSLPDRSVYFHHTLLPHVPWVHAPSGKVYSTSSAISGHDRGVWVGPEPLIALSYQRHLLQVALADRLVEELVDRLRATGLYDRALIVVTADHGYSFRSGDAPRRVTETNVADLMSVPLFVKLPGQRQGVVSDRSAELVDLLPTIADVLGVTVPWPVDGRSLLAEEASPRPHRLFFSGDTRYEVEPERIAEGLRETVARKLELFGDGGSRAHVRPVGPHDELIGREVAGLGLAETAVGNVELDQADALRAVKLKGPLVPAHVSGRLFPNGLGPPPSHLAIALNGVVREVASAQPAEDHLRFEAVLPEAEFREGANEVEVLAVIDAEGGRQISRLLPTATPAYALGGSGEGGAGGLGPTGNVLPPADEELLHDFLGEPEGPGGGTDQDRRVDG
jgi:Sulfatase